MKRNEKECKVKWFGRDKRECKVKWFGGDERKCKRNKRFKLK